MLSSPSGICLCADTSRSLLSSLASPHKTSDWHYTSASLAPPLPSSSLFPRGHSSTRTQKTGCRLITLLQGSLSTWTDKKLVSHGTFEQREGQQRGIELKYCHYASSQKDEGRLCCYLVLSWIFCDALIDAGRPKETKKHMLQVLV